MKLGKDMMARERDKNKEIGKINFDSTIRTDNFRNEFVNIDTLDGG